MLRFLVSALLSAAIAAWSANLTGTWQMQVQHDHTIPMALVLAQDGTTLKGTLTTPHGETIALAGELRGVSFTIATAPDTKGTELTVTGRIADDGSLDGSLSGTMGQMRWTAERMRGGRE